MGVERHVARTHIRLRRKGRGRRAGETMVETIVAFSMILLMLATVTAMLRFALNENRAALMRMEALEKAETEAEAGLGTAAGSGALLVDMAGYGGVSIAVGLRSCGESGALIYFAD